MPLIAPTANVVAMGPTIGNERTGCCGREPVFPHSKEFCHFRELSEKCVTFFAIVTDGQSEGVENNICDANLNAIENLSTENLIFLCGNAGEKIGRAVTGNYFIIFCSLLPSFRLLFSFAN